MTMQVYLLVMQEVHRLSKSLFIKRVGNDAFAKSELKVRAVLSKFLLL